MKASRKLAENQHTTNEKGERMMTQAELQNDAPDWMCPEADPFNLDAVVSSKMWTPQKIIIYGVPGVGKTSFAATFPAPILIRFEDGAGAVDCPTFPKVLENVQELNRAIQALKGKHTFKTVILDSLDWLEPLVWSYLCRKEGKPNIESFGYGKGYTLLDDVWRNITAALDTLQHRGMNIISICHAAAVTFDPPDSDPYMTYSLKLHKRAAAIWTEWADMILFCNFHKNIVTSTDNSKGKAYGNGDRIVYTSSRPAYTAKSRWPLPNEIFIGQDVTWQPFHDALVETTGHAYTPERTGSTRSNNGKETAQEAAEN